MLLACRFLGTLDESAVEDEKRMGVFSFLKSLAFQFLVGRLRGLVSRVFSWYPITVDVQGGLNHEGANRLTSQVG